MENQPLKTAAESQNLFQWCARSTSLEVSPVIKLLHSAYSMRLKQAARLEGEIDFLYEVVFSGGKKGKNSYPVSLWAYLSHSNLHTVMTSNV